MGQETFMTEKSKDKKKTKNKSNDLDKQIDRLQIQTENVCRLIDMLKTQCVRYIRIYYRHRFIIFIR